jgi:hypothetical protein
MSLQLPSAAAYKWLWACKWPRSLATTKVTNEVFAGKKKIHLNKCRWKLCLINLKPWKVVQRYSTLTLLVRRSTLTLLWLFSDATLTLLWCYSFIHWHYSDTILTLLILWTETVQPPSTALERSKVCILFDFGLLLCFAFLLNAEDRQLLVLKRSNYAQ